MAKLSKKGISTLLVLLVVAAQLNHVLMHHSDGTKRQYLY